jgi:gamma-glutamyltranspeptidase/glutathione hydrolase
VQTFTQPNKKVLIMKLNRSLIAFFLSILVTIGYASIAWASLWDFVYPPSLVEGKNQIPTNVARASRGKKGLVVGTTGAEAQRIGGEILRKGGNAVDAAVATAMGQIVLAAGSWVSFAGTTNIMIYDQKTHKVFNLNGDFNTVLGETDYKDVPSIDPAALLLEDVEGHYNGRTVAVPGFMKAVYTAHQRFGRLTWQEILEPVIKLASEGFVVNKGLAGQFAFRKKILSHFDETRSVFTKPDGTFYKEGDVFKQPALASTLREVQKNGADYMYTGPWAERMVDAVRNIGGRITLQDLANYQVIWSEDPPKTSFNGFEVFAPDLPAYGGVNVIEGLNLIEAAGLNQPLSSSVDSVFWLAHIVRAAQYSRQPDGQKPQNLLYRLTKDAAGVLWKKIQHDHGLYISDTDQYPKHSDGIATVDQDGNMVAMVHSIETLVYGETGLVIGGISISDGLTNQLDVARATKPGSRLPGPLESVLVFKNEQPYGAFSSIGAGLHERLLPVLYGALGFGRTLEEVWNQPAFGYSQHFLLGRLDQAQVITSGAFAPGVIERVREMGIRLVVSPSRAGYAVGLTIDPNTGERLGCTENLFDGRPVGY